MQRIFFLVNVLCLTERSYFVKRETDYVTSKGRIYAMILLDLKKKSPLSRVVYFVLSRFSTGGLGYVYCLL